MNILFYNLLSFRFGGGFEHWILEVTKRLKKFNVYSTVVSTNYVAGEKERYSRTEVDILKKECRYFELPYIKFAKKYPLPYAKTLLHLFKSSDIIYFSNAYAFQDLLVFLIKTKIGVPVVSGQHANLFQNSILHDFYMNSIGKKLLRCFDAFHVLNANDLLIFRSWGLKSIYMIPVGVDTKKFKPANFKRKNNKFQVLFVGRLINQKGIDILCESIDAIKESNLKNDIEFIVVGSGPLEHLISIRAEKYSNIRYFKKMKDERIREIYRNSDVFVMPSRRETFGIVALEAQASGLPVIASDIPGPRDILDENSATLITKESSEALSTTIKQYYHFWRNSPHMYELMRKCARENVIKNYDWDFTIRRIYDMLYRTINKSSFTEIYNIK